MTLKRFLVALVDSAFDRIESSVPPCVSPEETNEFALTQYRHGILETVAATFQSLVGSEQCWTMQDLMIASGFEKAMNDYVEARLLGEDVKHPAEAIVNRLLAHQGIDE